MNALHFSRLVSEQRRSRNISRKISSSHCCLCYLVRGFLWVRARFRFGQVITNQPGEYTSVWHLAGGLLLWNIESAKRFELRQHPAVPLQFNTKSRGKADGEGCSGNLIKQTHTVCSYTHRLKQCQLYMKQSFNHSQLRVIVHDSLVLKHPSRV